MKRRTLIRLLVGLGIGIPLLVEGITFFGLLEAQLLGGDDGGDVTATPAWTPEEGAVSTGEELLAETVQTEQLTTASLVVEDETRVLTLTARVDNPTNATYEFQFGAVTTGGDETIDGGDTTGTVPPGESGLVTAQWRLSGDQYPRAVEVTAVIEADGSTERVERTVPLARIPIVE